MIGKQLKQFLDIPDSLKIGYTVFVSIAPAAKNIHPPAPHNRHATNPYDCSRGPAWRTCACWDLRSTSHGAQHEVEAVTWF